MIIKIKIRNTIKKYYIFGEKKRLTRKLMVSTVKKLSFV